MASKAPMMKRGERKRRQKVVARVTAPEAVGLE
jgi:hypothetical protein